MFFDEIAKIEAHESEVLCVEFTPSESGNDMKKVRKCCLCLFVTL